MPHSLTERQKECLEYIRGYIAENESSPRLEEIAAYLGVKLPTAHKLLEALQSKGYLYFHRDKASGFFIRRSTGLGQPKLWLRLPWLVRSIVMASCLTFPRSLGTLPVS